MTKTVILMRHGAYGSDTHLTPEGIRQARSTAEQLVEGGYYLIDGGAHSPITRVVDTVRCVTPVFEAAANRNIALVPEDTLAEYATNPAPALAKIQAQNNVVNTALFVTHQPNITGLTVVFGVRAMRKYAGLAEARVFVAETDDWSRFGLSGDKAALVQIFSPR